MSRNSPPPDLPEDQTVTLLPTPEATERISTTVANALSAVNQYLAGGQPGLAEHLLLQLRATAPDSDLLALMLANLYADHGQPNLAMPLVDQVLDSQSESTAALTCKAKILYRLNRSTEAARIGEQVRELDRDDADNLNNLGVYRMSAGDFDGAAEAYRAALTLRPDFVEACHNLMRLPDARLSQEQCQVLHSIVDGNDQDIGRKIFALLSLATQYRHEGHIEREFEFLNAANQMLARARPWDQAAFAHHVDEITALTREDLQAHRVERQTQTTPIFIASMPRAGSTLIEQLLSTHPDIGSIGEAGLASQSCQAVISNHRLAEPNWWRWLARPDARELLASCRQSFDLTLAGLVPTTPLVSEKSINNDIMLGLCLLAFPQAVAVHCRRDPLDICLSAYQTYLPQLEYTHRLDWLAKRFELHERLMDHWRELFPGRIIELRYESLVSAPETEVARLFDTLSIGQPAGGTNLQTREYAVSSASNWQVRQPIYQSSKHRWQHYAAQLDEIMYLADQTPG